MKGWLLLAGSGLSWDIKGGCSLQVQINVKCHGQFQRWLLFGGGCSLEVVS